MRHGTLKMAALVAALVIALAVPALAGDFEFRLFFVVPVAPGGWQSQYCPPPPCGGYGNNWGGYQPQPRYNWDDNYNRGYQPQPRYGGGQNAKAYNEAYQNRALQMERQERSRQEEMARQAGRAAAERQLGGGNGPSYFGTAQSVVPAE